MQPEWARRKRLVLAVHLAKIVKSLQLVTTQVIAILTVGIHDRQVGQAQEIQW